MRLKLSILILCLVSPLLRAATTNTAASTAWADVNFAITNGLTSGDTVIIPAGSSVWATNINFTNLNIIGAGVGQTIIIDGMAATNVTGKALLSGYASGHNLAQIFDITFRQYPSNYSWGLVTMQCLARATGNWTVQRCEFLTLERRGLVAFGFPNGLVSDCRFQAITDVAQQGVTVWGSGTVNWQYGTTWGSSNRTYIEDCVFDFAGPSDAAIEGYYGASFTPRFNIFTNAGSGMHGLDSSSWAAGGSAKCREFYNNLIVLNANASILATESRGGSELTFSNTFLKHGSYSGTPALWLEAYRSRTSPDLCSTFAQGCIDGSNPYDGNQLPNGWPGAQLPGTTGPFVGDGTDTNVIGSTYTLWHMAISREWSNYWGTVVGGVTNDVAFDLSNEQNDVLVDGRDYTNNAPLVGLVLYTYPHPLTLAASRTIRAVNATFETVIFGP